jgi:ribonuclease G
LTEWLLEEGIGETRAILVGDEEILEAVIELPSTFRVGAIVPARLTHIVIAGRRGIAAAEGGELLVEPLPAGLTEGAAFRAEILREAIPEAGRNKLAKARATEERERAGPTLRERLGACTTLTPAEPDRFEQAGWSELLDQAASGEIPFPGGALRMSLTPAMTLFDVDGGLPPDALAEAGAAAAARAIRRFGIAGSIGLDLPTLPERARRQAAAAAVDALLPQPFERTAVNGFGFLQIVRRRERASIPEIVHGDPVGAAARALLRRAERAAGHGPATIRAAETVTARIAAQPEWIARVERTLGAALALQAEAALAISAGHVHRSQS